MYVCMYMYTYIHTHPYIHTYIHTYMHTHIHAHTHTHTHTHGTLRAIAKRKEAALVGQRGCVQKSAGHIDDRLMVKPLFSNLRWVVAYFRIPVA